MLGPAVVLFKFKGLFNHVVVLFYPLFIFCILSLVADMCLNLGRSRYMNHLVFYNRVKRKEAVRLRHPYLVV